MSDRYVQEMQRRRAERLARAARGNVYTQLPDLKGMRKRSRKSAPWGRHSRLGWLRCIIRRRPRGGWDDRPAQRELVPRPAHPRVSARAYNRQRARKEAEMALEETVLEREEERFEVDDGYDCMSPCPSPGCEYCKHYWERMVEEGLWVPGEGWTKRALLGTARLA